MTWISKNWFQVLTWAVGLGLLGAGWYSSLNTSGALLDQRIKTLEANTNRLAPLEERFYRVESQSADTREDLTEIKDRLTRIENKLDRLNGVALESSTRPVVAFGACLGGMCNTGGETTPQTVTEALEDSSILSSSLFGGFGL